MSGTVDIPYKAMLSLVVGQRQTAREILSETVKNRPENIMAWLCLAISSPHAEAITILEKVLELDPTNPVALRNLKRLKNDPNYELDLETFWSKEDLSRPRLSSGKTPANNNRRVLVPMLAPEDAVPQADDSLPTTEEPPLFAPDFQPEAQFDFNVQNTDDDTTALADFGEELATMQLDNRLADFGEETPTMPRAFQALIEIMHAQQISARAEVIPPAKPLIRPEQEKEIANWLGVQSVETAGEVGSVVKLADLEALVESEPIETEVSLPPFSEEAPIWVVGSATIPAPAQVVGHENEILERYRPEVETLVQSSRGAAAFYPTFSIFTAVSLAVALLLISLIVYAVLTGNAAALR